ncbi:hypothetical protein V2J09_020084 [Rumex salicifolius]
MNPEHHSAIKSGNTAAFKKALEEDENATLNARTTKNDTVLHVASKYGRAAILKLIIGLRPEMVIATNVYGETPMHVACMRGHLHIMKMLMESNQWRAADVDNHGRSPIYLACYYNRRNLVEYLMQFSWIPGSEEDGGVCLHIATLRGHKGLLLKAHPTLALVADKNGDTALHVAVSSRKFQIAEFLINTTKVDVDARNAVGKTAFDIIAAYGSHDLGSRTVHKLLLEKQQTIHGLETEQEDEEQEENPARDTYDLEQHRLKSINRRQKLKKLHRKQQKQQRAHKRIYEEALQNARNTVVIVAVLIATVAFTAGMSPPGGVYQDGPHIGKSVLAKTAAFKVFMVSNMAALFASLGIVIVLVSVIPYRRKPLVRILKYSHRVMWVAVVFMAMAFVAAFWATLPSGRGHPHDKDETGWMVVVLLVVAGGSLGAVFFGYSVMLGTHLKRKSKWRRTRVHDDIIIEQENGKNQDEDRVVKRRLRGDFDEGSSLSDVASSSNLGYHPAILLYKLEAESGKASMRLGPFLDLTALANYDWAGLQILLCPTPIRVNCPPASDDLKQDDAKAIDVRFRSQLTAHCVFRGTVSIGSHDSSGDMSLVTNGSQLGKPEI